MWRKWPAGSDSRVCGVGGPVRSEPASFLNGESDSMRSKTAVRRVSLLTAALAFPSALVTGAVVTGIAVSLPAAEQSFEEALMQPYQTNTTLADAHAKLRSTNERVPQQRSAVRPLGET